jgi:hypothetical protein
MKKVLFIVNKYIGLESTEFFYSEFLISLQKELNKYNIKLSFVLFSKNLENIELENKYIFEADNKVVNVKEVEAHANRIEKEYNFTFKKTLFPDLLQTFKGQNGSKIVPDENSFNELNPLVFKFLYLEKLIIKNNYDIIFSDTSPEYEMEFGRIIGNKLNKIVLKEFLGNALGNSTIFKLNDFGNFKWIEVQGDNKIEYDETKQFIINYKKFQKEPYRKYFASAPKTNFINKLLNKKIRDLIILPFVFFNKFYDNLSQIIDKFLKKTFVYKKFDKSKNFLFYGFHLITESTVTYKSMPYTNQKNLIEMISRVLPYNYYLYVREHPHWPKLYKYNFLKSITNFPNIKIISPDVSIHDIISNSKGILSLSSTTGIEALMYGKPVLSFASNIYTGYHSSAIYCQNLYELDKKIVELINTNVDEDETVKYINRLKNNSVSVGLGSYNFYSEKDSQKKANTYAKYFKNIINSL